VNILRPDGNVGALGGRDGNVQREIVRADHDLVAVVAMDQGKEIVEEVTSLVGGFVLLILKLKPRRIYQILADAE
jgi:hypothetical protein